MSDGIGFVTAHAIADEELKTLISELGGFWNNAPTINQGVLTKGSSSIWCSEPQPPSLNYSLEDLMELADRLGGTPQSVVSIDIGHGPDSIDLALMLGRCLVERWGGVLDNVGLPVDPAHKMIWKAGEPDLNY